MTALPPFLEALAWLAAGFLFVNRFIALVTWWEQPKRTGTSRTNDERKWR